MREELSIYFENSATDALGYECVEGKVLCDRDGVSLRYKQKDRAFKKNETNVIELTWSEVESMEYSSTFFGPKILTLRTRGTDKLEAVPGAEVGKLDLYVIKSSREEAEKAANFVEYRQSEAYLAEKDASLAESRKDSI